MATLRTIRRRITSVKNTQQITKAMKMVAASKLRRAQEGILRSRPYALKMLEVLSSLAARTKSEAHPLLVTRETKKVEILVVTSDRGMCGGFNTSILRAAERFMREHPQWEFSLVIAGRKAYDYFKRRPTPIRKFSVNVLANVQLASAIALGEDMVAHYLAGGSDRVVMVYNEFKSAIQQRITVEQLLPIKPMEGLEEHETVEYEYEPGEEAILDALLPRHINIQLFRVLLESAASEHGARMTAMDSATKNAREMIDRLTLLFNRTRQSSITKELMEVISGAEAIK
jgi:F-type H+-transporting ATPase subunit gamma